MRSYRVRFRALIFFALLLLVWALPALATPKTMGTLELNSVIREAKGRVVVVNFFSTSCPPCMVEIPGLVDIRRDYPTDDLVLMGLSFDEAPVLEAFLRSSDFNYPMYIAKEEVARFFRVSAIPRLLIYDKNGVLVVDHEGLAPMRELRQVLDTLLAQ